MDYPTKTKLILMLFLASFIPYNNYAEVNEIIDFSSEKAIDFSFYDRYEANWKNLKKLNSEFLLNFYT